ncbi:calcium/sodium antiporter [Alkalibacter saccharofermentans]|uniref:Cation:H+ antiporter n=1 Tax=Alkalibacter saccharofermentans DSM 14828 TaxID=1120975 RepID=A0A1M4U6Z4_9FIRM|nr:calcium/sodium antiporter [Alkalibacter saccharofermentans]SHE52357.1 cation:H+ antiporter [Alkalibacter saccharofermentans DSM 14828]
MDYLFLALGLMMLVKGADFFVEGSSSIAKLLNIPPILIGLTIVAFGTSSPEAAVSISAAVKGTGSIALGNIIGSNIFNASLVVGVTAFIYPLKVQRQTIKKEIPLALLASIMLIVTISDVFLQGFGENIITRSDGLMLLGFFSIFLYYVYELATHNSEMTAENSVTHRSSTVKIATYTIGGLTAIIFGGNLVVNSSITIALNLGMSQTLVGLTIVAIGTSLPELITSITAARKKESEIALGNIVGSNIFNILFILGASSVISPLDVDPKIFLDAFAAILITFVLLIFSSSHKKISKKEGAFLLLVYIGYTVYIVLRN